MNNAKLGANLTQFLTGLLGIFIAVIGYFLVDRDAEIRSGLSEVNNQVSLVRIDLQRLSVEENQSERRGQNLEQAVAEIRQRLARLEAFLERGKHDYDRN